MYKIFYGWWVVLAASLIHMWGAGTFFYSFTAFFNPVVEEFGWSYAATSFAASLRSVEGGIASPLVGLAVDRYGARRLLFLGSVLSGLGFVFLSRTNSLWSFYLIFVFLSVGSSLLFPIPGWAAVANWFVKHRGKALGLLSAAIGMGGMLIYFVNWLIGCCGWRMTMIIIGIGMWVIGIPCSLMVRHSPEPYGFSPDGRTSPKPPLRTPEWVDKKKERDSQESSVIEAMKKYKAVYFVAVGGAGALISQCIKKVDIIAYEDLGPEAIRRLDVMDLPLIVANDCYGGDLFKEGVSRYRRASNR